MTGALTKVSQRARGTEHGTRRRDALRVRMDVLAQRERWVRVTAHAETTEIGTPRSNMTDRAVSAVVQADPWDAWR